MKRTIIIAIAMLAALTSCSGNNYAEDYNEMITRTEQAQVRNKIQYAQAVLIQAHKDGFLDAAGYKRFCALRASNAPLKCYIALIEECEREESFYDVVGSTDVWDAYASNVLNLK